MSKVQAGYASRLTLLLCVGLILGADARGCCGDKYLEDRLCEGDQDCMTGTFCDKNSRKCRGCTNDKECADKNIMAPFCNAIGDAGGKCEAACNRSEQCVARDATKPTCDDGTCRGCKLDSECSDPARAFCENQVCRGCNDNAECVTKKGKASPICEGVQPTKQCRACASNADCESGLCVIANSSLSEAGETVGACVATDQVVYVQLRANCAGENGTSGAPYCQIATAVQNVGAKRFVLVKAPTVGGMEYSGFTVPGGKFAVIGPGADPQYVGKDWEAAALSAPVTGAVKVQGASTDVTLDGLKFGPVATTIECNDPVGGAPSVTIRRSVLQAGTGSAVLATACKQLTVDRSKISGLGTGIRLSNGSTVNYRVSNSLLVSNSGGPGAFLAASASGTFEFNTVTDNGMAGQNGGGVICESGATKKISNSIVTDNKTNNMAGTRSQFGGDCQIDNVVVGTTDTITGGKAAQPDFILPSYKLKPGSESATNKTCCIDQAATGPAVDYFSSRRPEPNATKNPASTRFTLGFHEVE